jgi:signal transduction histidine kinase
MPLHEFIRANRASILARISAKVSLGSPIGTPPAAAAAVAVMLDEIVDALEHDGDHRDRPSSNPAHDLRGRELRRNGGEVDHIAHDYGAVCDCILSEALERSFAPSPREYQLLNLAVDDAISGAMKGYEESSRAIQAECAAKDLAVAAHEIRNALHPARFGLGAILAGRVSVQSKTAAVVDRSLCRAVELAEGLLASVKERHVSPEHVRLPIADLLNDLASEATPERGILICVQASADVVLEADPKLLRSAIGNLLQNALKFTLDATTIVMRALAAADRVCVEVEDACGGLPPGAAEELFAPFVQRPNRRGGAGLGLSIVRDIAMAHGGEAHVRNLPGKGCVFWLDLPALARQAVVR